MNLWLWGVAAIAVAWGGWRVIRRRDRACQLMLLCQRAGLEFSPIDPFPDTLSLPFRWLGDGRWVRAENVVWNRVRGDDVRAFDLLVEQVSRDDDLPRTVRRHVCASAALALGCPRLEVRPRDAMSRVTDTFGGTDVELELEAFGRRFRVRCDDRRFAVAFCDQRMMRAMMALPPGVAIAVNEDRLLVSATDLRPSEMLLLLEAARAMRRAVPPVLAGMYPPRPTKGPHEDRWMQGHWSPAPIGDDGL